jgi:hypothetical protein
MSIEPITSPLSGLEDSVSRELKGAGQMRRLDANTFVPFVSFPAQHRLQSARNLSTKKEAL